MPHGEAELCPVCGLAEHSFMRIERIVAAVFNGLTDGLIRVLHV